MGGRSKRKVFCEATTRKSIREGKPRNCMAKGYLCANGRYLCRFHGSQNIQGFKRPNYTDDTRKNQLKALKQFRNYTDEQLDQYYREKIQRRIESGEKSIYHTRFLNRRKHSNALYRIQDNKSIGDQLKQILQHIEKKSST